MGSLKNEMKSPTEDNVSGDSTQDGACSLVNSDTRAVPERPKSPDCLVQIYVSIDCGDEGAGAATTEDPDSSAAAGGCGDIDVPLASCRGRDCAETATEPPSLENEVTSTAQTLAVQDARPDSTQGAPNQLPKSEITRADAGGGTLEEQSDLGEKEEQGRKEDETECVTSTLDSLGPSSPAPVPKQHIHTQVSLEVVQCHSVATSPMTPPEVGATGTFFFPLSCGINDTDTQVGRQVEYRSVATAPMTPRTPTTPAGFLATIASERKQKPTEKTASCGETEQAVESGSSPGEGGLPLEPTPVLKAILSKEETQAIPSQESFTDCPKTDTKALCNSEAAVEDDKQPSKQYGQRMGSMEQDITILVTHYDGPDAEDGEAVADEVESSAHSTQPELGKINECEEHGSGAVTSEVSEETTGTESEKGKVAGGQKVFATGNSNGANLIDSKPKSKEPSPTVIENIRADDPSLKSCLNESQALSEDEELDEKKPFGGSKEPDECSPSQASRQEQKIHTQVSLEVVQCHSVATSPMTPPQEGATGTFFFPSSSVGRKKGAETQDAEMQVGRMVEYRSVATAPMTPRTPTSPSCFPEFTGRGRCQAGKKIEEKSVEEKEEAENRADGENKEQEEPQEEQQEKRVDDKANDEGEGEEKTERKTIETKTEDQREEEKKKDKAVELKGEVERKVNGKKDGNQDKKVTEKVTEKEENKTGGKETATLNEDPLAERTTTHSKGIASETVPQIKQERKTTKEERGEKQREKSAGKGDQEKAGETKEEKRNGVAEETTAEEPVQEVRWDEKGMTWEVYGAVVEVAVLGTAIQKHLEKQVKKQKKDSASILPPPPPLNPSAVPPPSTPPPPPPTSGCSQRGSGKGRACKKSEREGKRGRRSRRNPFRLLLQNIQQPHCCARAHSTE